MNSDFVKDDDKTCAHCYFFEAIGDDGDGHCHRYPPIIITKKAYAQLPLVTVDDWCGEGLPK